MDEFLLDGGIVAGAFDASLDVGIVGTSSGSLWHIAWAQNRSKTRLLSSHMDHITGLVSIGDVHVATSSHDGTVRVFELKDRQEVLRFDSDGLVSVSLALSSPPSRSFLSRSLV